MSPRSLTSQGSTPRELKGWNRVAERRRRDGKTRGGRCAEMTALRDRAWPGGVASGQAWETRSRQSKERVGGETPASQHFSGSGRVQLTPSQEQTQSTGMAGPATAGEGRTSHGRGREHRDGRTGHSRGRLALCPLRSQADGVTITTGEAGGEVTTGRPPQLRRWLGTQPSGEGSRGEWAGRQSGPCLRHQNSRTESGTPPAVPDLSRD